MAKKLLFALLASSFYLLTTSSHANAANFEISSNAIKQGQIMQKVQEFNGFGCNGTNIPPDIAFKRLPKKTKSIAITLYDPDAPTGSGWWHWIVINIDPKIKKIESLDWKNNAKKLSKASSLTNDYGENGYGGMCPPPTENHRYILTAHALDVESLPTDATSSAVARYMIQAHTITSTSITSNYIRKI